MRLSTEFLTYFFLAYCVFYNLFLSVSFLAFRLRPKRGRGAFGKNEGLPIITLMIPALNEERVLRRTVERLLALPYPGRFEILIIDDNSDDATGDIARELCAQYENVLLLQRGPERSRKGKGDVLNHGFSFLRATFPERDERRWIIGVFDADGRPTEEDFLLEVGQTFTDHTVAAAQCGVRIRNGYHLLAALQDVEFATFSFVTQTVRDRTSGAVALGGNGQFIRASVLTELSREGPCWDGSILTEDLDIGTRIHLLGGRIRFIDRWVEQEGVESIRALFCQRHRWAWGTLQVFLKYFLSGRILRAKIPLAKKLDLHYYLSFWTVPFVVLFSFLLSLLSLSGIVEIVNRFGPLFLIANSFSFIPMMVLGLLWARVPVKKILYLVPLAVLYAYHWIPVLVAGWISILSHRRPHWTKTERFVIEEPAK
jgi:cellulose synthase/poly-beta-1,6-N-acetylglucosamine synthase-like glycosyltransferase